MAGQALLDGLERARLRGGNGLPASEWRVFLGTTLTYTTSILYKETYGGAGAKHYYRVRACHNSDCGGWSNVIEVTDPTGGVGCPPVRPNCHPGGPVQPTASPPPGGGLPPTPSTWRLVVHYTYDSLGVLASVYAGGNVASPYWKLVSMDAAGRVTEAAEVSGANTLTHTYDAATGS